MWCDAELEVTERQKIDYRIEAERAKEAIFWCRINTGYDMFGNVVYGTSKLYQRLKMGDL